eukprot:TRINITY_DN19482_c0_g1_i1.p1 TRINITY_DN19482_c0_g1~~TRINITY_DN19482_c0_g1_i1.p1  ORF type:complete len:206 (+),score=27.89 TRINITY_DN19482_c0_g1_i1:69-686(+)
MVCGCCLRAIGFFTTFSFVFQASLQGLVDGYRFENEACASTETSAFADAEGKIGDAQLDLQPVSLDDLRSMSTDYEKCRLEKRFDDLMALLSSNAKMTITIREEEIKGYFTITMNGHFLPFKDSPETFLLSGSDNIKRYYEQFDTSLQLFNFSWHHDGISGSSFFRKYKAQKREDLEMEYKCHVDVEEETPRITSVEMLVFVTPR